MKKEDIAKIVHQALKAYCETQGDYTQFDWDHAEQWQREAVMDGVNSAIDRGAGGLSAREYHEAWVEKKQLDGWVYGEEKSGEKKTHPLIVPYDELTEQEKAKDRLSLAIIFILKFTLEED